MAEKLGWTGRFFEDFEVGDIYPHQVGRTVLSADNSWFSLVTQGPSPVHFDHHYASQTEFKKPLVNSSFILGLVTGQSVSDLSSNVFANLGCVDGFDQGETGCECDDGCEVALRLLAS